MFDPERYTLLCCDKSICYAFNHRDPGAHLEHLLSLVQAMHFRDTFQCFLENYFVNEVPTFAKSARMTFIENDAAFGHGPTSATGIRSKLASANQGLERKNVSVDTLVAENAEHGLVQITQQLSHTQTNSLRSHLSSASFIRTKECNFRVDANLNGFEMVYGLSLVKSLRGDVRTSPLAETPTGTE